MKIFGRLQHLGWGQPTWPVIAPTGDEIDLKPLFWDFAERWKDKPMTHDRGRDHYELKADAASEYDLIFETRGAGILLSMSPRGKFGFSNVVAYLDSSLGWLNGRLVVVEITTDAFSIKADPSEEVFGVYFYGDGNSARVPEGAEHTVCKVGTADACLFAACGSDGFSCLKFSDSSARMLLGRKAEGSIRAQRIGNCALLGREEEPAETVASQ